MLESLLAGAGDWGLLAVRLALGAILIVHGYPKVFGGTLAGQPLNIRGFSQFVGQLGFPVPLFFPG